MYFRIWIPISLKRAKLSTYAASFWCQTLPLNTLPSIRIAPLQLSEKRSSCCCQRFGSFCGHAGDRKIWNRLNAHSYQYISKVIMTSCESYLQIATETPSGSTVISPEPAMSSASASVGAYSIFISEILCCICGLVTKITRCRIRMRQRICVCHWSGSVSPCGVCENRRYSCTGEAQLHMSR